MIRIAILDDQKDAIAQTVEVTKQSMRDMGQRYELTTYDRAKDLLYDLGDGKTYDVYLLDVEMEQMTGIEVAREIRKIDYESIIIYVTNYVEYAVDAFEVNAYRYIPKKLLKEKLPEAFRMLCDALDQKWQKSYVIEKNHIIERIPYGEIYYLQKEGKNTLIVHKGGTAKVRQPISDVILSMDDAESFIQVDRSYVVNGWHVMSLRDQQVVLRDGSIIPVSAPRLKQVKNELMRYWR